MTKSGFQFSVFDCFTDQRFGGNIGAVVFDAGGLSSKEMASLAKEINAPVTGFVTQFRAGEVSVRFFMPEAEIAMCGHVTVGLFAHLAEQRSVSQQQFTLKASAGDVAVDVTKNLDGRHEVMMSLSLPKLINVTPDLSQLAAGLGLPVTALQLGAPIEGSDAGLRHMFVHLTTSEQVRNLSPNFSILEDVSRAADVHTIACFALNDPDEATTLTIRDFCPVVGVNEAPASGTTNGALAGYLVSNDLIRRCSQRLFASQGIEIGRPSMVVTEIELSEDAISKLRIGGSAVPTYHGTLLPVAAERKSDVH